ncbi:MAG: hypothetical protein ACM3YO_06830 [Bacteroidota bacterium]
MSLQRYLEVVSTMIGREANDHRRETLLRYQQFIELAIREEEANKLETVG